MSLRRFEWTDSLLTGIEMIDAQHREYFRRVNEVLKRADSADLEDGVRAAVLFVQEYAIEHFDAEQTVMTFNDYPGFEGHLGQHQTFASRLDALTETLENEGFRPDVGARLSALLVDWFVKHIRTEDRRLADYVKARAATGPAREAG